MVVRRSTNFVSGEAIGKETLSAHANTSELDYLGAAPGGANLTLYLPLILAGHVEEFRRQVRP